MTPKQMSLSMQHDASFERHRKPTRRDVFLAEMDQVVPWTELCAVIEPYYPKDPWAAVAARSVWSGCCASTSLSDSAVEVALYDSAAMRRFVGIDLGQEGAPDETTVCKFRHLLEKHGLAGELFVAVSEHLKRHGMKLSQGTIAAPRSSRHRPRRRTRARRAMPRCTRRRRASSGTSG